MKLPALLAVAALFACASNPSHSKVAELGTTIAEVTGSLEITPEELAGFENQVTTRGILGFLHVSNSGPDAWKISRGKNGNETLGFCEARSNCWFKIGDRHKGTHIWARKLGQQDAPLHQYIRTDATSPLSPGGTGYIVWWSYRWNIH